MRVLWFRGLDDWAALLVPALIVFTSFLSFVLYFDLKVLSPELLLSFLVLGGAALSVGLLFSALRSKVVRAVAMGLLLLIFFDAQFRLVDRIDDLWAHGGSLVLRLAFVVGVLACMVGLLIALRAHLSTILLVGFGVTLASMVILPPTPAPNGLIHSNTPSLASDKLSPMVHIILDGHIGLDGVPLDIEGGLELREDLLDFYVSNGFRIYGRAYSKYFATTLSVSELLNRGTQDFESWLTPHDEGFNLDRNDYFDDLASKGYAIRVYSTNYLMYCGRPGAHIEVCYQFDAASPRLIREVDQHVMNKAKLLLSMFAQRSTVHDHLVDFYDGTRRLAARLGLRGMAPRSRKVLSIGALESVAVLNLVASEIGVAARGRVYFAHVLLPHEPYVFEPDCRVRRNMNEWFGRRFDTFRYSTNTKEYREAAYKRYLLQVRCVMTALTGIFDALRASGQWDDATVIIHGDHGSRNAMRDPVSEYVEYLTPEDMVDIYSTLFAIRSPGVAPGYNSRTVSVQDLFGEYFLGVAPERDDGLVYTVPGKTRQIEPLQMVPIGAERVGLDGSKAP